MTGTDEPVRRRKAVGQETQSTNTPSAPTAKPARLTVDSHRALVAKRKALISALAADEGRGRLLFANAALAFKDAGIDLSPDMADHLLHAVRQSVEATTQRERLTAQLKAALGVIPHPSDPAWLAKTLFTRLDLPALKTAGCTPTYLPAVPLDAQARLRAELPPPSRRRVPARAVTPTPDALWRIDLDAAVPDLPTTERRPTSVTLETLWFYLPRHDLVRPLLELGILERSVLPTLTATQFRAVKAGKPTGGFIDWVETVTFPTERVAPRRAPT